MSVASDSVRYRILIPYGILLKLSHCGVVTWHWARAGIPGMWKPFVLIDAVMGVLFVWAWAVLRERTAREQGH